MNDLFEEFEFKYRTMGKSEYVSYHVKITSELIKENSMVLDLGGGTGTLSDLLRKKGCRVVVAEISKYALKHSCGRFIPVLCDGNRILPFKDNSFDYCACLDTLSYFENPLGVIEELKRVSRARIIISEANFFLYKYRLKHLLGRFGGREYQEPYKGVVRMKRHVFDLDYLTMLIEKSGLKIEGFYIEGMFPGHRFLPDKVVEKISMLRPKLFGAFFVFSCKV